MKVIFKSIVLSVICLFLVSGCNAPQNSLAKVGPTHITNEDFSARLNSFPANVKDQLAQKEAQAQLLTQLVDEKVIQVGAMKAGYEKTEEFKTQLANYKEQLLIDLFIRDRIDNNATVTEEEVELYYTQNSEQFKQERRRARHILVATQAEADALLRQLKRGASFSTLASQHSQDTGTRSRGGDLGYFTRGRLVPEFEKAVFSLKRPNELSGVVKTQFGYHLIQLTEIVSNVSFEQAQGDIRQLLVSQKKQTLLSEVLKSLKEKYKVEVYTDKLPLSL